MKWILMLALVTTAQAQMVPWLTRSHDNQRTNWNTTEYTLTDQEITTKGLNLAVTIPVYGDARGVEAQPLIVPQVQTPTGVHDVMLLASMANQVRGVDAETGADLWDRTLGQPILGNKSIDGWGINQYWGPLSTGVVDPISNKWYQVFWASPDGSGTPQTARYYMAVMDVATGSMQVPPVLITGTSQGYDFNRQMRKARSSAVLLNQNGTRTVIQCTGTIQETASGAAGYCFAFDTYTNQITTMLATTAGEGAGIWMAGQGLSCDPASTYCYAVTGNGNFDGETQWGESFIQLSYTPPTATSKASMQILKAWSPWNDLQRSGQQQVPAGKLAGDSMPSEAIRPVGASMAVSLQGATLVAHMDDQGAPVTLVYPDMATGNWSDEDWGSSGPACIFSVGICVAAGKDGIGYPIGIPNFVRTTTQDVGTKANCAKLIGNPAWLTMSPGNVDPCPVDPKTLNFFPQGDTAHLHMTPAQAFDPVLWTNVIYVWGENQQLHKWKLVNGNLVWVANGHEYASANVRGRPPGGMSGGFCAGSGNSAANMILVCTVPLGDANRGVVPGRILVYDAVNLAADGSIKVLWDSADWGSNNPQSPWYFMFNKFMPPMVDGGEIIVPTYDGRVMVLR